VISRIVKCPECGKPTAYDPANKYRPFCSERCNLIDLGEWASNKYAVAGASAVAHENETDDSDDTQSKEKKQRDEDDADSD
jgi:endogenous inhibitor of DNA gyrase (YacG/DUF329 family)